MSTLSVDTLTDKSAAESVDMTYVVHGTLKVWAHFNISGGTPSLTDSMNVSSIDDDGVGDFGLNLTNNLSAANESAGTGSSGGGGLPAGRGNNADVEADTASSLKVSVYTSNVLGLIDSTNTGIMVVGDLA